MEENFDIREQQLTTKERDFENALRPLNFEDFSGQDKVVDNLRIFVKAARLRAEALDHVLLHGPPGLGKTTLAGIVASESRRLRPILKPEVSASSTRKRSSLHGRRPGTRRGVASR